MAPEGEMTEEYGEAVAPQYNLESTLTVDIKPGTNTVDFPVESKRSLGLPP
jgi:hypothetical protein